MLAVGAILGSHHITMYIQNHHMGVDCQLSLEEMGAVSDSWVETTERTLKTWRILLRSIFQAAIVSLLSLAWTSRETTFRPLCFVTFLLISSTVLRSRAPSVNNQNYDRYCDPRRQLIYRLACGLAEVIQCLPTHPPIESFAYISTG